MPKIALPHIDARNKRRLLTTGKVVLAGAVVLSAIAWLAGPPLIRSFVAEKIGEQIGRKVEFGDVSVNPLRLAAAVRNIAIYEPDQKTKMVSVGELRLNMSFTSLMRLAPVLDELTVDQPVINIAHVSDDRFNFSDIVDKFAAQPKQPDAKPTRFSLNNIRIMRGELHYDDRVRQSRHAVTDLNLALPFLSNLPYAADIFTEPSFRANIDGSPIFVDGEVLPFASSHKASIQLNLDGLELPRFMPFVPPSIKGRVASGLLDTRLHVEFEQQGSSQKVIVSGTAGVRQMKLEEAGKPVVQWNALNVALDRSEPLSRKIGIKDITFDAPEVWVDRAADGTLNLQKLIVAEQAVAQPPAAKAPAPAPKVEPMVFNVDQFAVKGGSLHVRDAGRKSAGGQPATVELSDIQATLTRFSTAGEAPAALVAAVTVKNGGLVKTEGQLRFAAQSMQGKLQIEGLKPQRFEPFYSDAFTGHLGETEIHGDLNYQVGWPATGVQATLSDSSASLRNLQVSLPKQNAASVSAKEIAFTGLQFDLGKQSVSLDGIAVDGAKVAATRAADGKIDLASMTRAQAPAAQQRAPAKSAQPWRFALGKLSLAQSEVAWNDSAVAAKNSGRPASLRWSNINARVQNVSYPLAPGAKAGWPVELTLNDARKGSVTATGTILPEPFAADLKLDIRALDIAAFQPYAAEYINAAITGGALTANGRTTVKTEGDKPLRTSYVGNLKLANLRTVDKASGSSFVRLRALDISRIDAQLNTRKNPVDVTLGDVALSDFYARVILNPDGRLNLANIRARPETESAGKSLTEAAPASVPAASVKVDSKTVTAPVPVSPPDGPAPLIRVGRITLQKGNVNFSDFFVKPNYTTNLTGLTGSISKVAADDPTPANVEINGKVDGDAPINITGQVNPFAAQLFLDLTAQAKGIELTRLTPYAAKYAGYPITKGKLSVNVKYRIENGRLEASNNVFLDQLTFGERVDSPDATKLPVLLAVALLKNSRGEIDVNLPVSGSLSDPQFSIGGVIVRVIVNLLAKAVTSPFALIASAIGGGNGDELGYVEFAPGTAKLGDEQQKKLDTIAKALNDRPALKLDIVGRVDPDTDRNGAKREYMMRRVRAQKRQDLIAQGGSASPEEVQVKPEEYAKYLERAYKEEKFKKPRNLIGLTKSLPVEEMETLIIENATVGDVELKALADRRASAVKSYLEEQGKIPNARLFLVAPKLTADGISDKGKPSRVDFSVQM